ncbi:MAG: ABC transporter permease [Ruminococcus sp.]|uniref:ABC transporter permease n=1 Tax=Ruminococcus sp. TaxID=41978 RepID=UPI0025E0BCEB|nr:ABC transporter permease [Ruminococcus sp.]MBR5683274.1 ABC transporter permease [Ruminococcus sp.]
MRLILKHTFKNMLAHKFKTFLLIICVAVCSFTAMLSFDMSGSLNTIIRGLYSSMMGTTDLNVSTKSPVGDDFAEGLPDSNVLPIAVMQSSFDRHIDFDISYVNRSTLPVFGFEEEAAKNMRLLRDGVELGNKKAYISDSFAKEFEFKEGDTITLHGDRDKAVDFTVAGLEKKQGIFTNGELIVISFDDMKELTLSGDIEITQLLVDVKDDSRIGEAEKAIKNKYPTAKVENLLESKELQDQIKSITRLFLILFAVCMLLVIFVTISVSERMIVDKMSVVGTFRSLGVSSKMTTFALLLENSIYGLIGALIGVGVYVLVKKPMFDTVFVFGGPDAIKPVIPSPKPYVYIGVILVAILIECLCPIKETVKAIKTPIRDIIFNTKDTEYRPSRIFTMIGLILLAVSVVTFFFKDSFVLSMVCFVSFIAAAAMLFNYVERFIAKLLTGIFAKTGKPIAHLASIEAGSKKSSVGSSVLCLTAAALAIVLYIFTNSLVSVYDHGLFDSDVIVQINGCKPEIISYVDDLDGVERTVFHYMTTDKIKLDDHKLDANIFGLSKVDEMIKTVDLSKDGAADDEILVDTILMKKYGYSMGDEINITFLYDGYLPMERTLKIGGTVDFDYFNGQGSSLVISEKTYKEIYNDFPLFMLVKGNDAKAVKKTIQDHSADYVSIVYTRQEYDMTMAISKAGIKGVLNLLILIGVALTFIGVVSNQLIGLEGRKRECAVMTSVAMPRSKLSKMFLIENLISAGAALLFAVPVGVFMSVVFRRMLMAIGQAGPNIVPVGKCVIYAIFLYAIFTLVSLFPIRAVKKMDLVSQLKYE